VEIISPKLERGPEYFPTEGKLFPIIIITDCACLSICFVSTSSRNAWVRLLQLLQLKLQLQLQLQLQAVGGARGQYVVNIARFSARHVT